ncbi:MAG: CoA-binding protein [candidate division NC10 bacterium]|nr:CoA-binding protein [candidate division NC10 bacterium]
MPADGSPSFKSRESLQAIFRPRSVAVIGASTAPEKLGYQIFRNILEAGFPGTVYPINPKATEILGRPCYPSIDTIPAEVDLATIIIPAPLVADTIRQCSKRGAKGAIVISGGFSETGPEGEALQDKLLQAARESNVAVIGPNCQGVNNPHHPLCASWPLLTRRGGVAIVSQSGTVGAALMDWASQEELGVSTFVSLGNRADVDEADLIHYFAQDPHTRTIAIYMEGVKAAHKFLQAVRQCRKPLVVLKAGRTPKGRKAAESHTRSLAGRDEVYEGVFRQLGIHRADDLEQLYDFSKALAYLPRPRGRRLLIVTSSGGSGILATDMAENTGLDVVPLPEEVARKLRAVLPKHCIVANPLDLTGDANAEMYRQVVEAAGPHFDIVGLIFGDPIPGASKVVGTEPLQLVIYLGGAEVERQERLLFHQKGIPVFPTPERGIRALSELLR